MKYLTPSAQEQQVFLQKQQQQLEQLLEEQKALELQQQQAGWDIEHEEHDPNLDKKILETKDQIQQIERQVRHCSCNTVQFMSFYVFLIVDGHQ